MKKEIEKIETKDGKKITKIVTTTTPADGLVDKREIDPSANYEVAEQRHYGYAKNIHYEIDYGEKGQKIFDYTATISITILGLFMVIFASIMLKVMGGLFMLFGIYGLITVSKNRKKKDDKDKHTKE